MVENEIINKKKELLEMKKQLTNSFNSDDAGKRIKEHIIKLTEENEKELMASRKTI